MTDDAKRFADFARITGDWFWEAGPDGRFTYFSGDAARSTLALDPRIGKSRRDGAAQDRENLARLDALDAIVAERKPFRDVVYRAISYIGPRWVSVSGEPRSDAQGEFAGYRGIGRDITALIETREELGRKSRALEAILQAMPDGVHLIDAERRTVAINDRLYEILGIETRAVVAGEDPAIGTLLELARRGEYGPGDPEQIARERIEATLRLVEKRESLTYERRLATGRWMEGRLRPLEDGSFLTLYRDITEAKVRAEEVERQSALLESIFNQLPGGIVVYDHEQRLVAWNDRYAEIIGADPEVLKVGVSAAEVVRSQAARGEFGSGEEATAAIERRLAALRDGRLEFAERVRPNRRAFEMRRGALPGGGSVSIYLDTTDRARAAGELRDLNATLEKRIAERTAELADAERFQRSLIASVPGMVYRCRNDRDWTMEFASPGSRELLGVRPGDLMDGTVTYNSLIHPQEQEALWQKVQADFAKGDAFEHEYRVRGPDGGWRWVWDRAHAIRDGAGKVMALEGLVLDVDARRNAEQAARAARDNLMDALDSLDDNLILYDRDDRLVLYTRHLLDQYRDGDKFYRPGRKFAEIFREVVEHGLAAIPAGMTRERFIAERLEHHWRADGTPIVRHLPDGRVLSITEHRAQSGGIVSVGRDVTRQLKVDAQLREAQRMDAIGRLTGGLAHDLNNYLAVVIGNLDLLRDHDCGPDAGSLIEGAMSGAQRGAELTRSLLAFSRRQPLAPRVLDVGRRVSDLARLIERTIGEKIAVELAVAPDLWPVRIDGAQLDSCIVNLANNARDAMPDGGRLTIRVGNADPVRDDDGPPGPHVLLEMADTGAGMSGETLEQAFEPFFTTKAPGHGTGLGLSMVHGFVHQSGGEIRMTSVPGEGTGVRIFLPRSDLPRPADAPPGQPAAIQRGSEHVLLVEDNEHVRATASDQLVSLGYRVTEADSGDRALALLEEDGARFQLVFSDIVMPGRVDGYDLARLVAERWPGCKILLSSGFAGEPAGATGDGELDLPVLRKPYRKAELARALREALDERPQDGSEPGHGRASIGQKE